MDKGTGKSSCSPAIICNGKRRVNLLVTLSCRTQRSETSQERREKGIINAMKDLDDGHWINNS